jgi:hypothetical protein
VPVGEKQEEEMTGKHRRKGGERRENHHLHIPNRGVDLTDLTDDPYPLR